MKKIALAVLLALMLGLLAGCRETVEQPVEPAPSSLPDTLAVEFAPESGDPAQQMRRLGRMAQTLQDALADAGAPNVTVTATLGSAQAATAQALDQGGVDAAVFPMEALTAFDGGTALAAAAWPALSCDSGNASDWNAAETVQTEGWTAGRRVLVIAGPSAYGQKLAERVRSGGTLTWEELSRAGWGLTGGRMESAVDAWLAECFDTSLAALPKQTDFESEDELFGALAAETVDLIPVVADDRMDQADRWSGSVLSGGYGRGAFLWDETAVVAVTAPWYGTVLAVGGSSAWAAENAAASLMQAVESLSEDADWAALSGAARFAALP